MADLAPFEDKTPLFLSLLFSFLIGNQLPLLLFLSSALLYCIARIWCAIEEHSYKWSNHLPIHLKEVLYFGWLVDLPLSELTF